MRIADSKDVTSGLELIQRLGAERLSWQNLARCKGRSLSVFYPQRGVPTASARALCRECPVKIDCLEYAIDNEERFGIWGGLSERERRKLQRERQRLNQAS